MRTFLENKKTKDNKFISFQLNKTKFKSEHEQGIFEKLRNRIDAPLTLLLAGTKNDFGGRVGWLAGLGMGAYLNKCRQLSF